MEASNMKIEHIAMYVNDLEKSKNFFIKYFNAKAGKKYHNLKTGFQSYFLSFEEGCRLEIMWKEDINNIDRAFTYAGYAHMALSVGTKQNVDTITQRLKNDGYNVISGPRTTGDGYYESCIVDAEGNQIEITV